MTKLPLAGALAIALATGGSAFAATAQTQDSTMQTPAKAGPVVDPDAMKSLAHNNLRQQLQDQLAKAGYTSIKVMPSSFYVQAKDKKGDPVEMVIGPDTFTEVTEVKAQANAATPQHPAQQQSSNATQK
jgi:hypothetical protein